MNHVVTTSWIWTLLLHSACVQRLFGLCNYIYLLTAFVYFFLLLFAHLHVQLKFRMCGALHLLPHYAFMACARTVSTLYYLYLHIYLYLYLCPYLCLYLYLPVFTFRNERNVWKFYNIPIFYNSQALCIVKLVSNLWDLYDWLLGFWMVLVVNATETQRFLTPRP